jgi:hypothetical protein
LAGRAEARRDRQGDRVLRSLDHVVNSAAFSPTGRKAETPPIAPFSPHSPDDAAEIIENDRVSEKT